MPSSVPGSLNLKPWVRRFSLKELRRHADWQDEGMLITSPFHLAVVEQLRAEVASHVDLGRQVPTDVCVFGKGVKRALQVVQVGGVPYRARGATWPTDKRGQRLAFIAQFWFGGSMDIVPAGLPGDMLLVFANSLCPLIDGSDSLVCEWQSHGISTRSLTRPQDIPDVPFTIGPLYGVRYRTADFPDAEEKFRHIEFGYLLHVLEGTKIGGCPHWIQEPPNGSLGSFLCSLASVQCVGGRREYPWINHQQPLTAAQALPDEVYFGGDCGTLNFFLREDGTVRWALDDY